MKKKICMLAGAALLAALMTVQVLANPTVPSEDVGGGDQTIQGEGYVGFGEVVPDEDKSEAPLVDKIDKGDEYLTGTGVAGAEVTVKWPDGSEVTVAVGTDGKWQALTPRDENGKTLQDGDVIWAWQVEEGKHKSDNVSVTVGSGEGGTVEPEIPIRPEDYLNVTIPAKFFWWVVPEVDAQGKLQFGEVASAEHYIRNNGFHFEKDGVELFKEYDIDVTLTSFRQTAGEDLPGLTLHLTDDLAKATHEGQALGAVNLAAGNFSNASAYAAPLKYTDPTAPNSTATVWSFGFAGNYTGSIPTIAKQPRYEMTLHFSTDVQVDPADFNKDENGQQGQG